MRQVQLMRQTTSVGIYWQQKKVTRTSSGCECVAPPIQLMRLAVAWAALYSGLVECVCSEDLWVLCATCGIGYKLPVASRRLVSLRNWMVHVWAWSCSSLPVQLPSLLWYYMKILGSRGHTP